MPKGKNPSLQNVLDEVRAGQEQIRGHGVILEDIRSQNRATMEALQASRAALEEKLDQVDRGSKARDAVLEAAVRQNSKDIRVLTTRVDALGPLDQRVSALERRSSQ
jgi:uncharacterized protein YlxW (UPF0749 family)